MTTNETQYDTESEISTSSSQDSEQNTKKVGHLWQPGISGNPAGRPKGSKSRITAQKLKIEEALRDQLNLEMPEILLKAIEMAKKGDRAMIKLLVEMTMSKPQSTEEESEVNKGVKVTIRNLTLEQKQDQPKFIDAKVVKTDEST